MASGVGAGIAAAGPGGPAGEWAGAPRFARGAFPELDCLRGVLPGRIIAAAERRAERLGTGADRALIAAGAIDEESYLRALGGSLNVAFETFDGVRRTDCALEDQRLVARSASGILPLTTGDDVTLVVAPRDTVARHFIALVERDPGAAARLRLATADRFNHFIMCCAGQSLAESATGDLLRKTPALSAASSWRRRGALATLPVALAVFAGAVLAPGATMLAGEVALALFFLAWLGLRLFGAFCRRPAAPVPARVADAALPVYSVIAALYREASSVKDLLLAIERLDYPPEKLDVVLAVEADDSDTRDAIAAYANRVPVSTIVVPAVGPRTKPKALNVALPFARGQYTVIYDAEDRPDPDQLRCALQAFATGGSDLACVQARLSIDNTEDSLLARYFTAEYAGQFDVFLPGLCAMGLPLPLGGSSNHFPTATLRKVGGWDSYNVTEDADLGMRLARLGYRSTMITSTTYEEAPAKAGPWLRQRTRWFKGWMQTWLVHMRQPRRLIGDLGVAGFAAFQLMVGGNVLAALVHPLFGAALVYSLYQGVDGSVGAVAAAYAVTAAIGYLSSALIGGIGLARRGEGASVWVLLLTPLHWLLLSAAAWRALYQLVVAPYAWEKTEHGLAKHSRRSVNLTGAVIRLERSLRSLDLPTISDSPLKPDGRGRYGTTIEKATEFE